MTVPPTSPSSASATTTSASPAASASAARSGRAIPYRPERWDLSDILPDRDEATIADAVARLDAAVETFASRRDALGDALTPADFLAIVKQYEALVAEMDNLGSYASLWFSEDTQNAEALSFRNRVMQLLTGAQNRILFFGLWWKGLDDDRADALLPSAAAEPDLRHHLEEMRRLRPFTLEERSEQIINIKNADGIGAVLTLHAMLNNRQTFEVELDGETRTLTDGEARNLYYHPDPAIREAVYREHARVYERDAPLFAQIYANRARDWANEYVELRGFASPISVRNQSNDIPDEAVETLMRVVQENAHLFQDYFRLKAKWLGMDQLRRFDIYAPLASSGRRIPYEEAVGSILDTFDHFDSRIADLAERVFSERHIDAEVRKGKRSGAFCATVLPRHTPWMMLTYDGSVRDVATLAHELGHAIHSMLAADHSVLTQHASLPLAETASVFAEMLMTDRLLAEESDPMARRELLAAAVDDVYATVLRQTYFVLFEKQAHQAVLENRSAEALHAMYLENLHDQFGDALAIDPCFRYEWVSVPHIFQTPFYCYAYSFGNLLVLALYRRFKQQGDAFKPGYIRMLAQGGSARPQAILEAMDVDMTDPAFWQGGFEVVREMLDELRTLDV